MVNWRSKIVEQLLIFLIGLTSTWVSYLVVSLFPLRFDLTEEHRFSVSPQTQKLLESLDAPVYFEIYLNGDLPSGFQRLRKSTVEMIEQFRFYTDQHIYVSHTNPDNFSRSQDRNDFFKRLAQKGIPGAPVIYTNDGAKSQKLVAPGLSISYAGGESSVLLLQGSRLASVEETLNQSIENLEYNLASSLESMMQTSKSKVGLIVKDLDFDSLEFAHFLNELNTNYHLVKTDLKEPVKPVDLLLLLKPKEAFEETEIYHLDQFVMRGGRLIMFLDPLAINRDSIGGSGTYALPFETGLENLLFKYGVRVNSNYVLDVNSGDFPVITGQNGNQPQIRMLPWPFFPVMNHFAEHSITRNLDAVYGKFVSTIDTVKAKGIKKTALISTSPYSRTIGAPVQVSLNELQKEINPQFFTSGIQNVAYLLEGKFHSVFKNRLLPEGKELKDFVSNGKPTKIIVCADADLLRNEVDPENNSPYEMGFDPFKKRLYANKDFLINSIEYLLDDDGLILTRLREVKVRPLDKVKVRKERRYWQVINLVLPIVLLIVFGVVKQVLRRRKWSRF